MINFCREQELMVLPRVGKKTAKIISKFRDLSGNITPDNIHEIQKLSITEELLDMIDFTINTDYDYEETHLKSVEKPPFLKGIRGEDPHEFQKRMIRVIDEKNGKSNLASTPIPPFNTPRMSTKDFEDARRKVVETPNRQEVRYDRDDEEDFDEEDYYLRRPSRSSKRKPRSEKHRRPAYSPGCTPTRLLSEDDFDDEEDDYGAWGRSRRDKSNFKPASLPKSLTYDGKTNWIAFKRKFIRYAAASKWTEEECLDALCWCLTGKASDFYALISERNEDMAYFELLGRLEKRFGTRELPETLYAKFSQAVQSQDEDLEDWADRIQTLAIKAFKGLPEQHMMKQAIVRFCQGCTDKEAGQAACNARPKSLDKALDHVRWFQYTHQAIYRSSRARDQKRIQGSDCDRVSRASLKQDRYWGSEDGDSDTAEFLSASAAREDFKKGQFTKKEDESNRLDALETTMSQVLSGLEKVATAVNKLNYRRYSRSPSPGKDGCYFCGSDDHFKKQCPLWLEKQDNEKHVAFREDLNKSGSDSKAKPRPGQ